MYNIINKEYNFKTSESRCTLKETSVASAITIFGILSEAGGEKHGTGETDTEDINFITLQLTTESGLRMFTLLSDQLFNVTVFIVFTLKLTFSLELFLSYNHSKASIHLSYLYK